MPFLWWVSVDPSLVVVDVPVIAVVFLSRGLACILARSYNVLTAD